MTLVKKQKLDFALLFENWKEYRGLGANDPLISGSRKDTRVVPGDYAKPSPQHRRGDRLPLHCHYTQSFGP
jgi:hypothetical protein